MKSKKNFYISSILTATAVLAVLTVFFGQNVANKKQETRTQATVSDREVKLSLFPKTQNTSVGENVSIAAKVLGTGNRKIASILLSVKFDSSHIRLQTIDMTKRTDGMSLLKATAVEKANSQGSFKILSGAESEDGAPQGVVNLPAFSFEVLKEGTSELAIVTSESQLIFVDGVSGVLEEDGVEAKVSSRIPTSTPIPEHTVSPTVPPVLSPTAGSTQIPESSPSGSILPSVTED